MRLHKKSRSLVLLLLICAVLLVGLPQMAASGTTVSESAIRKELSSGVENIVKRAYQMTNIQWTPKGDITGWGGGLTYYAGTTYTGLPYGQPVYASYVPWYTSLAGFVEKVNDPTSKMYTSYSSYNKRAPYYSIDCSAFVSWAWGLSSRQTTSSIHNYATQISTSGYENAEVGDCLCLAGSHVVLITDITYDANGTINSIEISESTVNKATNYCCQKTRYGVGGSYTLSYLTSKYFGNGYILYRSKNRDSVTYTHCCAVPLPGDSCSTCGYGTYTATPMEAVVVSVEDVALYAAPNQDADRVGTVYAGNSISVDACYTDTAKVLWYRADSGEWFLASQTKPQCSHSYAYSIQEEAACTHSGTALYRCTLCQDSYTEILPATGHAYQNGACAACGQTDPTIVKGDINADGVISSADSVLIARFLADLQTLTQAQQLAADVNQDGVISSADAVSLSRYLAGITDKLFE